MITDIMKHYREGDTESGLRVFVNYANASSISAPVLLVTGDRSASRYSSMHSGLESCLTQVSKVTIADAGHMMFQSNPTEFTFEVQYFISPE